MSSGDILAVVTDTNVSVKQLFAEIANTNSNVEGLKDSVNIRLAGMESEITKLKSVNSDMNTTNRLLSRQIDNLCSKVDYLENQSRRNNLVLYGCPEDEHENWYISEKIVIDTLSQYLAVDLADWEIERAHRVGTRPGKRPIVFKLLNFKTKTAILKNSRRLRGTNMAISEDFSDAVKRSREYLKQHLISAKGDGCHAFLRFDKLIINGETWTVARCEEFARRRLGDKSSKVVREASEETPSSLNSPRAMRQSFDLSPKLVNAATQPDTPDYPTLVAQEQVKTALEPLCPPAAGASKLSGEHNGSVESCVRCSACPTSALQMPAAYVDKTSTFIDITATPAISRLQRTGSVDGKLGPGQRVSRPSLDNTRATKKIALSLGSTTRSQSLVTRKPQSLAHRPPGTYPNRLGKDGRRS